MSEEPAPTTPLSTCEAPAGDTAVAAMSVAAALAAAPAEKPEKKPLTSVHSLGISSDRNARFRRTMEDCHTFVDGIGNDPTAGFFAIYDGHGGKQAAEYAAQYLHTNLLAEIEATPDDVSGALSRAFMHTDNQMEDQKIRFSGCTAVVCYIRKEGDVRKLYSANVGDARAVLCRGGEALRVTFDHKATDEQEIARIQAAGGFVVQGRVNGILAVSRSLGDRAMKQFVFGDPFVSENVLTEDDTHLVIACDGVWDVITDQHSVEIAARANTCGEASKDLLVSALRSGSTDNISVMVVKL